MFDKNRGALMTVQIAVSVARYRCSLAERMASRNIR
jgi:hypothetical protein